MVYFEDRHRQIIEKGKYPAEKYKHNPMDMLNCDDIKSVLMHSHVKKMAYKYAVILVKCGNRTAPKIYRFDNDDSVVEV